MRSTRPSAHDTPSEPRSRESLYEVVANTILKRIQAQEIKAGEALPSERELCLEFNVSRQTVRNAIAVLSERGVLDSRAGAGHFVRSTPGKLQKSSTNQRSTRQIGVIYPPQIYLEEPTQWNTLMGLKGRLSQDGYSVTLSVSHKDEKAGFMPCYQHWLEDGEVAGYIGVSIPASLQRRLFECGYPAIAMGYVWEDIDLPSIALDFRRLYDELIVHLAGLGHRSIGAVLVRQDSKFTRNILEGIASGTSRIGAPANSVAIRRYADTAYDLVSSVRALMRSRKRPTALLLQGDEHLDHVMRFFEMEGIRIPDDLHLTVVQVRHSTNFIHADRVAYFQFDYVNFGRMVAQQLLDIIEGKPAKPLHKEVLLGKIFDPSASVPTPV